VKDFPLAVLDAEVPSSNGRTEFVRFAHAFLITGVR
jgi:hypothetical protein